MKNLLIYINPTKTFFGLPGYANRFRDCSTLVKIQIDNSLDLGWKKEDILLVTNFDYEYNGVKTLKIDDSTFCSFRPLSTKTVTVSHLLEKGFFDKEDIYWVHDFDAYQNSIIKESDINLDKFDVGFTDYGWSSKWSLGSYFFKPSAKEIFKLIRDAIYEFQTEDERALSHLTKNGIENITERIKRLNITYNFGMRQIAFNYKLAKKPIKVLHFHPHYSDTSLACFMYGKNEINKPLMSKRLIKIFQKHGIK